MDSALKDERRREIERQCNFLDGLFELEQPSPSRRTGGHNGLPRLDDRRAHQLALRVGSLRPPNLDVVVRGRDAELTRLERLSRRPGGRFAVVCGPGGVGKSTLAAALVERFNGPVWWIRWRGAEIFVAQMLEIAAALGMPRKPNRGLVDLVWTALSEHSGWLLVVDNVDNPDELGLTDEPLSEYRGWVRENGGGLLLITSRDADRFTWGPGAEMIQVGPLCVGDAAAVLLDAARHVGNRTQAEALAERLDGFPLALRAAGRALAQPTGRYRTFDDYRIALDIELADILAERNNGALSEHQRRALLRYTWELSLDQLAQEGHALARPLLRMLSLTVDAPLPRNLVTPKLLARVIGHEETQGAVDGALAGLHRYGLVSALSDDQTRSIPCVSLHQMVRDVNALLLKEESDFETWQMALDFTLIADAGENVIGSGRTGWDRAHVLTLHLALIVGRYRGDHDLLRSIRNIVKHVANELLRAGYPAHELLLRRVVLLTEQRVLGSDHPDTLESRNTLGFALVNAGEYREAVELLRQNVADCERILGKDHMTTLGARNNLGESLRQFGDCQAAVELLQKVVVDCERILGPDHCDTLITRHNLAIALSSVGDHERGAELLHQNVADYERILGPKHPTTLHNCNSLVGALDRLGDHQRAADLAHQIVDDCERVLGPDHRTTLHCRDNLATIMQKLGEQELAADLRHQVVADLERILGPDHPDTVSSRNKLAGLLAALENKRGK